MSLPSLEEAQVQKQQREEELTRLKHAYDMFISEWERVEKEEKEFLHALHEDIDKHKLSSILKQLESLN